ncbi:alpha/beta-hydrolase [Metschnikowia bicuspidata var. bicuspidata NRRL YB-4993]|uniref:Putative lipase ATG15 n=1 Tax=Metschnikowia bicuspidata var. bicuspidata NRRL YB-4993 TaxID=869754 RepID=A0A1A0HIF2_9ASCO|nr:alpha/beta-hydrolase [Metschnikowia bicuspidata var. bicuspidata NRRL YB-4993]OBA23662.1 alpha/beta-hydrolase [Metschnikowia bicuspidata var. bicuspidata NRRL YB-4993]
MIRRKTPFSEDKNKTPNHALRYAALFSFLAILFIYKLSGLYSVWSPLGTLPLPPSEYLSDSSLQGKGNKLELFDQQFQLKHIFHHGTGDLHRVHRRLDITPKFLEENEAFLLSTGDSGVRSSSNVDESNLNSVLSEPDWPKSKMTNNPWTVQLPIRERQSKAKVVRLTERHSPNFLDSYLNYAMKVKGNPKSLNLIGLEWDPESEIRVPDIKDRDTVVSLATISSNAYVKLPRSEKEKEKLDWVDVGDPWAPDEDNADMNFGWLENGLRGHVFVSNDSKTVVIGIKGTSGAFLPGGGSEETSANDKTNDNLLFLCCCARVGYMWTTVCDCYEKAYTCNQDCLESELLRQDRYYQATLDLYRNVTKLYPPETTDIWVTGHSLGGALASLLGRTYGLPVVAFEAPGEMLASQRLHLPKPPGIPKHLEYIWHFGNTADPIFMGVCNGASSSCSVAGYAMETACHTGQICVYDVVTDKGWHVNLLNHRIHTVIDDIILAYNETAPCEEQPPCKDCFNWRFTSNDDNEPDEPKFPNPFKPKPSPSVTLSSTSASSSSFRGSKSTSLTSGTSEPTEVPKKCLKRTWYGWCLKWGHEDESR